VGGEGHGADQWMEVWSLVPGTTTSTQTHTYSTVNSRSQKKINKQNILDDGV